MSTFQMVALIKVTFLGADTTSTTVVNISIPGIKAGDVIVSISNGIGSLMSVFGEQPIQTDDQISQYGSTDLSATTLTMVLLRFA